MPSGLKACLQNTSIPRLRVITSGFIPSNPTEILGSALMQRWIDAFYASTNVDVILFDTPPCLMVADSSVLAATVKGEVVLVLDCGRTRRGGAIRAKEQFSRLGVTVRGVVVNRVNPRDEAYDYGYGYGYYYYYAMPEQAEGGSRGWLRRSGRRKRQT
jgi:Mrp family chromosome partitioning ATPase